MLLDSRLAIITKSQPPRYTPNSNLTWPERPKLHLLHSVSGSWSITAIHTNPRNDLSSLDYEIETGYSRLSRLTPEVPVPLHSGVPVKPPSNFAILAPSICTMLHFAWSYTCASGW